jgi:hypothetical protein
MIRQAQRLIGLDRRLVAAVLVIAKEVEIKLKIDTLVTSGFRSLPEQTALYAQGRLPLDKVNALRAKLGWAELKEYDNRFYVTMAKAGESPHNHHCAVDIVAQNGRSVEWSNPKFYDLVQKHSMIRKADIVWGGDWNMNGKPDERFFDKPHIELAYWRKVVSGDEAFEPFDEAMAKEAKLVLK